MKKYIKIIFYNIFIVILLFLACEIGIRIFYPEIKIPGTEKTLLRDSVFYDSPGLVPNSSGLSNEAIKYVDSLGFWKYSKSKINPKKKLLFLGDSITMGIGVENDSTFAGILNSTLSDIAIYNPSLIGYSSKDYLNIIKKMFVDDTNHFNITSVFIVWCLNDIYPNYALDESPGLNTTGLLDNILIIFRNNFKLFQLLKNTFTDRPKTYFLYDEQYYNNLNNIQLRNSINDLILIKSILYESNIEFTVILLPYEYQLREGNKSKIVPQDIMEKILSENHINYYNLFNSLNTYNGDKKDLYLYGDGIHFSNLGHRVIGEILINIINKKFKY